MAEIVLGIATSHSPQLRMAPEKWRLLMEKDERDPRFDYRALLKSASPEIRKELREEVFQRKYAACQTAIAKLRSAISEVAPDDAEAIRSWSEIGRSPSSPPVA